MIQLRPDCLIFKTTDGDNIPCSAELVTLELMGDSASTIDPELIENASAAVLHYFKYEREQDFVSVAEFAAALEKVLRGFGLNVLPGESPAPEPAPAKPNKKTKVAETDLREVAVAAGKGCELFFFPNLRDELKRKLDQTPQIVHFRGLRGCVKQLTGARRWSKRCESLSDQIVEYLRNCFGAEPTRKDCSLIVF